MRELDLLALSFADYQARILAESTKRLDCSSKVFLRRYVRSLFVLTVMDEFKLRAVTMDVGDALRTIDEEYDGSTAYGSFKYGYDEMYWLGYVTSTMVYMFETNTRILNSFIPYSELIKHYEVYHTQSVEWVAERVLEEWGINEEDLNLKTRFKAILKRQISEES